VMLSKTLPRPALMVVMVSSIPLDFNSEQMNRPGFRNQSAEAGPVLP
jgi:hypothetical protein